MGFTAKTVVADDLSPVAAYAAIRKRAAGTPTFFLESAPTTDQFARYSLIGWRPRKRVTVDLLAGAREIRVVTEDLRAGDRVVTTGSSKDVVSLLRQYIPRSPKLDMKGREVRAHKRATTKGMARVFGQSMGYVAYDLVHALEPVGDWPRDHRIAHFVDGAATAVFDGQLNTVTVFGDDEDVEATFEALRAPATLSPMPMPTRGATPDGIRANIDDAQYAEMVERSKSYIRAGDIFQVVLARTFTADRENADPFDVYRAVRILNASPYLYYLEFGAAGADPRDEPSAIAGASPETLVRLQGSVVTVRPIAGTRPRGADDETDLRLEQELLADPKERAEHVMLVDLGRNDVGRVAKIGTVRVPTQMAIERYSHVMHIVSEVHGELAADKDAWDVLAATFPAGTLSGAPKVRAMQIVRELEGQRRGVYGGAIGYVSNHSTMEMAIAIRTVVAYADRFEVSAGAGVVEGSVPELEAAETRHKAGASLAAVASAIELARTRRRSTT
jgi:anthranilate synthase component 1